MKEREGESVVACVCGGGGGRMQPIVIVICGKCSCYLQLWVKRTVPSQRNELNEQTPVWLEAQNSKAGLIIHDIIVTASSTTTRHRKLALSLGIVKTACRVVDMPEIALEIKDLARGHAPGELCLQFCAYIPVVMLENENISRLRGVLGALRRSAFEKGLTAVADVLQAC